MVSFTFDFDKPDKKYRAGDVVRCKIIVNVSSEFKARSLSARFRGQAHTEWTESRKKTEDGKLRSAWEKYDATEEYFRKYFYLIGTENASNTTKVAEGIHTYDVAFPLPINLPSSIFESNGYVQYDITAKCDVSWGFDKVSSSVFYVASVIDLNEFPHLFEPVNESCQTVFGCCCYISDPMHLINILPQGGYVPGDTIPITIQIDNNSDVRIEGVKVKLKEELIFITRSPRMDVRSSTKTLNEHYFSTPVAAHQNKMFQTGFYLDPDYDFKLFNGCGIITAKYYLSSEAIASGCYSNLKQTTNITIGTIPFNVLQTNGNENSIFNPTAPEDATVVVEQPLPTYNEAAGGLAVSSMRAPLASTEKIFLDDNLPPPSFEESQKLEEAIEMGEKEAPSAPAEHNPTAPTQ